MRLDVPAAVGIRNCAHLGFPIGEVCVSFFLHFSSNFARNLSTLLHARQLICEAFELGLGVRRTLDFMQLFDRKKQIASCGGNFGSNIAQFGSSLPRVPGWLCAEC